MKNGKEGMFAISIRPHGFQVPHLMLGRGDKDFEYRKINWL